MAHERVRLLLLRAQVLPRGLPRDAGHAQREPHADGVPREHRRDGEGPGRRGGRRRRSRALHAVRCVRAALPEHALTGDFYRHRTRTRTRHRCGWCSARMRSPTSAPGWIESPTSCRAGRRWGGRQRSRADRVTARERSSDAGDEGARHRSAHAPAAASGRVIGKWP